MFIRRFVAVAIILATVCAGSPATARFLQVDPVGYKDQVNLYTYVNNDPTNKTDPTGMQDALLAAQEDLFIEQNISPEAARASRNGRSAATIIGSAIVVSCVFGCEAVPSILKYTFRFAEKNTPVPSTASAQSQAADAAERIAPLARRRGLGEATASKTGGTRFFNPKTGDSIRVEPGNLNANFASGRQSYVKESFGGTVRDAGGNPIMPSREFPSPASNPASHIPAETYLKRQGL